MTEPMPGHLRETAAAYDLGAEDYAALLRDELAGKPLDRALLAAADGLLRPADLVAGRCVLTDRGRLLADGVVRRLLG